MTANDSYGGYPGGQISPATEERRPYMKIAMWIAIGALIAAALLCVVWVLIGSSQNGLIGRAFLTLLLLAAFAGVALLDASLAPRRPQWYVLASMIGWVLALIAGAIKIWLPYEDDYGWSDEPVARFFQFVGIVLVLRLAVLHVRLITKTQENYRNTFTRIVVIVTVVLVGLLTVLLIVPLVFPDGEYSDFYWRAVVAVAILVAVGTALVPLVKALNAPRRPVASGPAAVPGVPQAPQSWPTYVDGVTPLPVLPDGSPDWNAYYTGYPSYPPQYAGNNVLPPVPEPQYAPPQYAPQPPAQDPAPYYPPPVQSAPSAPYPPVAPPTPPVPPLPPT